MAGRTEKPASRSTGRVLISAGIALLALLAAGLLVLIATFLFKLAIGDPGWEGIVMGVPVTSVLSAPIVFLGVLLILAGWRLSDETRAAERFKAAALAWAHRAGCALLVLISLGSLWSVGVMAGKEGGRSLSVTADGWELLGIGEMIVAGALGLCGLRARWVWGVTALFWLIDIVARIAS
jgi:hypothetical protein